MQDTKTAIQLTALELFARDGYEAVSVSNIAGALGMVKSALYKHFQSKQDLFDSILRRMEELDAQYTAEHQLSSGRNHESDGLRI